MTSSLSTRLILARISLVSASGLTVLSFSSGWTMADEEDPFAEVNWGNVDDDDDDNNDDDNDNDDNDHDNDDMDDSGEDNDDEESGNDDDDDGEKMKNMETFIRTFHNGNYDIQFEAALSFYRSENVSLAHRPTQASYNKPDDWVERNRIGLEKVKEQLQTCIDSVSHDTSFNLELEHDDYHDRGEEPIVWHEPVLDEYWNQLDEAIRWRQMDIQGINISNVEMKKEVLAALVAMFLSGRATNSSTEVIFNNANLCREGITWLSKLVDVSSNLVEFHLHHNRIDNMDSARCLSRSLKLHTGITVLDLPNCDLGSSPEILLVILQSEVDYINLEHNNIDSLGAVKISEYLESDPSIRQIDLDNNRLNDNDAIRISQALKRNTTLTYLNLVGNNFTSIGVKLYSHVSLTAQV
jgi:hypothetical protein